jgi:hypothetical protein
MMNSSCKACLFLSAPCPSHAKAAVPESAPKVAATETRAAVIVHPAPAPRPVSAEPETPEQRRSRLRVDVLMRNFCAERLSPETLAELDRADEEEKAERERAQQTQPAIVEQPLEVPLVPAKRRPGKRAGGIRALIVEMLLDLAHRVQENDFAEIPKRLRKINKYLREPQQQRPRKKYRSRVKRRKVHENKILVVPSRMRRPRKPKPASEPSVTS